MVRRFSDVQLCEHFHWTPQIIADLPADFYEDTILIMNKRAAKQKIEAEKAAKA